MSPHNLKDSSTPPSSAPPSPTPRSKRAATTPRKTAPRARDKNAAPAAERVEVRIRHFGGAREVGGTSYLVEVFGVAFMVDFGGRNKPSRHDGSMWPTWENLPSLDFGLITHAHFDHIGALPLFRQQYPDLPIYAVPETAELGRVMLIDSAHVQASRLKDDNTPISYTEAEATAAAEHLLDLPAGYDLTSTIRGVHMTVTAHLVGHILGAVAYHVRARHPIHGEVRLALMGDMGDDVTLTIPGMDPEVHAAFRPHLMVIESTYGIQTLPPVEDERKALVQCIADTIRRGGHVCIPAFALGRAQEVAVLIGDSNERWQRWCAETGRSEAQPAADDDTTWALMGPELMLPNVPCYLEGLARSITALYETAARGTGHVIRGPRRYINLARPDQREIRANPCVIIAPSGMATGGRIVGWIIEYGPDPKSAIAFSGYVDEEAAGKRLLDLANSDDVAHRVLRLRAQSGEWRNVPIRASIYKFGLRGHINGAATLRLLARCQPAHVIVAHGDPSAATAIVQAAQDQMRLATVSAPEINEIVARQLVPDRVTAPGHPTTDFARADTIQIAQRFAYGVAPADVYRQLQRGTGQYYTLRALALKVFGVSIRRDERELAVDLVEEVLDAYHGNWFRTSPDYEIVRYGIIAPREMPTWPLRIDLPRPTEAWGGIAVPEVGPSLVIIRYLKHSPRLALVGPPTDTGVRAAIVAMAPDTTVRERDILITLQAADRPHWWTDPARYDALLRRAITELQLEARTIIAAGTAQLDKTYLSHTARQRAVEESLHAHAPTPFTTDAVAIVKFLGATIGWMQHAPTVLVVRSTDVAKQLKLSNLFGRREFAERIRDQQRLLAAVNEVRRALRMTTLPSDSVPEDYPFDMRGIWPTVEASQTLPPWPAQKPELIERIAALLRDCQVMTQATTWVAVPLSAIPPKTRATG